MKLLASMVAEAVGGRLVGPDVGIDEARQDSRDLQGGELFVPLVGLRDGHDFIEGALAAGAAAYFTAREPQGGTAIVVDDPEAALTALGSYARSLLPDRVVGITGSVGKTSAKDLAAAALGVRYLTQASLRSFNNEYGVPLTLINAEDGTEATVVEMGARGIGHIAKLCAVARPTVGVVTTVEHMHTEMFGDLETVARAKAELVEALPAGGTAVLNRRNELVARMASVTPASVLFFGTPDADLHATGVAVDADLRPSFTLHTPWGSTEVRLAVRGEHHVMNALAAAGAALACGVELAEVAEGLAKGALSPWRMELSRTAAGAVVLNDAYNAGPASMEAALRSLAHLEADQRHAVLGPMAELGHHEAEAHGRIAAIAHELGIRVVAVGAPAYGSTDGVEHVGDLDAALGALGALGAGDAVLVKGSRVAGLERLAQRLLDG